MNAERIKDLPAGALRHFQLSDGKSEKFWEIRVSESGFEVRFGKIGTAGQTQIKSFPDVATTIKKVAHLIAEKLGKGYVEVSQASSESDISEKVTPDYSYRRALYSLKAFASEQNDAEVKKYVEAYAKNSQSYCIPRFVPLDKSNPTHRLDDQVIRGFPFTSANWPWAMAKDGTPMQPLAQINLDRAGDLLGMDLGSGLLQVWVKEHYEKLLRIVPASALSETMDAYYPHDAAWNVESDDGDYVTLFYLYLSQMSHPRIEWVPAGRMFPRPFRSMSDWCDQHTEFGEQVQEQLSERIESLAIPMMERGDDASKWVHLGGYPGGYGNESDPCTWSGEGERLVLYIQDGNNEDVVFTLQVTVSHNNEGKPTFHAHITCDR